MLFLVSKGIPFDVAFSLGMADRLAYAVILGELDGGNYDWDARAWRRPGQ